MPPVLILLSVFVYVPQGLHTYAKRYKCVVVANGLFPTGQQALELLRQAEFVVACDGAVIGLENGRLPDAVVGDLDSLPEPVRNRYSDRIHRVKDQETNDLTKAVNYVKTLGFREVLILGATGRREDHTLGNISLLAQYVTEFERVEMVSDFGWFTPLYRNRFPCFHCILMVGFLYPDFVIR